MAVYGPPGNEELYHYGIKRRSGRYPFGSGENPYQSAPSMQKKRKSYGDLSLVQKAKLKIDRNKKAKAKEKAKTEASKKAAAEKKAQEEAKSTEAKKSASERVKNMTDEEVYAAIQRLRLEQSYVNLVRELEGSSKNQNGSQNQSSQQQTGQQHPKMVAISREDTKRWIDKAVDKTKKYADLATNVGNIAKGANTAYDSFINISKLAKSVEEAAKKK